MGQTLWSGMWWGPLGRAGAVQREAGLCWTAWTGRVEREGTNEKGLHCAALRGH